MAQENNKNDDRGGKRGGEFRVPPRTYIIWIAILGAIPLLMVFKNNAPSTVEVLTQVAFQRKVDSNQIERGIITYDPQSPYL